MKKFVMFLIFTIILSMFSLCLASCSSMKTSIYTEVSNLEELKNAHGKKIKLKNDIDGEYENINSLYIDSIDGAGHTIKNLVIHATDYTQTASLFYGAGVIGNLKLENITVIGDSNLSAAVVTAGKCERIYNVHLNNCSVTCTQAMTGSGLGRNSRIAYVGGIYGGQQYNGSGYGGIETCFDCEITDCTAENIKIEVNGIKDYIGKDIYAGGIAGACNSIQNCSVTNSTIRCISSNTYSAPFCAGIVAYTEGKVSQCYVENTEISAEAEYYEKSWTKFYSTPTVCVGSIASLANIDGDIKYCYAQNNTLSALSAGSLAIGGIIGSCSGRVSQSYATSVNISCNGYAEGNKNDVGRYIGGVVGKLSGNLNSCFAYENVLSDNALIQRENNSFAGGLIGYSDGATVQFAAAYKNEMQSQIMDEFVPNKVDNISDCYITGDKYDNINDCILSDETFWIDNNAIRDQLMLVGGFWKYEYEKIPYLVLSNK